MAISSGKGAERTRTAVRAPSTSYTYERRSVELHWTDGWRWLVACVVIGGLPLLDGPARALALGFLAALYLLTLTSIKQASAGRSSGEAAQANKGKVT